MNIEKELFPSSGKMTVFDNVCSVIIADAELDPLECVFMNDGCVEIDTSSVNSISLSYENLEQLVVLINQAEEIYKEIL